MYSNQQSNLFTAPARGGSDFLQGSSDAKLGNKVRDPLLAASRWLKRRSDKEKTALGCAAGVVVRHSGKLLVVKKTYAASSIPMLHAGTVLAMARHRES